MWNPKLTMSPAESSARFKNNFAFALFERLLRRPGNVVFSPFSIRTAFCMACAGARGETVAQMNRVLGFASAEESVHAAIGGLIEHMNTVGGGNFELAVANSVWSQVGAPLQAEYLDLVARHYGGGLTPVDFHRDPEPVRVRINQWVEDHTRQRIRDLVPPDGIHSLTRLVLANAVYFKGSWETPFDREWTLDEPFQLEDGGEVLAPLMQFSGYLSVPYMKADGYQAVDLDYLGGEFSMLVILPERNVRLRDFEQTASLAMLEDCIARLRQQIVELQMPRFKLTLALDLGGEMQALGMSLAFAQGKADFSGINGKVPPHEDALFLSAVFHKAFIEVNEEGTEAAAATALVAATMCAPQSEPPPVPAFRADHPFLFAIRDRKSGALLFLGRVSDPTRES